MKLIKPAKNKNARMSGNSVQKMNTNAQNAKTRTAENNPAMIVSNLIITPTITISTVTRAISESGSSAFFVFLTSTFFLSGRKIVRNNVLIEKKFKEKKITFL